MWTYNFKRLASVELSFWRHINFARTMNLQSHPLAFHRFQFDFEEENRCFRTQQHVISMKCPHQFDINSFKCNQTHRYFDTIPNLPNNGHRQMNDRHWIQKHQHNMHIITVNKQTQLKWIYIYWFSYFNLPIPPTQPRFPQQHLIFIIFHSAIVKHSWRLHIIIHWKHLMDDIDDRREGELKSGTNIYAQKPLSFEK